MRTSGRPGKWEAGFATAAIYLATSAVIPLVTHGPESAGQALQENAVIQITWLLFYSVAGIVTVKHWDQYRRTFRRGWTLWLTLDVAAVSLTWSVEPAVTIRRVLALFGTTLFGAYLTARFTERQLLRMLAEALGLVAVSSTLVALLVPSYGVEHGTFFGAWRGVFVQKNLLGDTMALSGLVFSFLLHQKGSALWGFTGLALSLFLIVMSTSATALVTVVTILVFLAATRRFRGSGTLGVAVTAWLVAAGAAGLFWVISDPALVLQMLGKDLTLTGRTVLWASVWDQAQERLWLGYGYSAFWVSGGGLSTVASAVGFSPTFSHNGFLDLLLSVGGAGVALFLVDLITTVRLAVLRFWSNKGWEASFFLGFLLYFVLANITESSILKQHSLIWMLYVATNLGLRKQQSIEHPERSAP